MDAIDLIGSLRKNMRSARRTMLVLSIAFMCVLGLTGAASPTAAPSGMGFCNFLYGPSIIGPTGSSLNGISPSQYDWSAYTGLLGIALVIVLAVLSVIGLVYATGRALGINGMVEFAKTEYFESFANVILIVVIAGGMTAVFSVMLLVSNMLASGLSNVPNVNAPAVSLTTSSQMYSALCSNYMGALFGVGLHIIVVYVQEILFNFIGTLSISLAPGGQGIAPYVPGFSFSPLIGLLIIPQALGIVVSLMFFIGLVNLGMVLLLFIIYYLFPIFLYLGILLRSFPWTRAAGGAFLALFIAFYIVMPAILYPFSLINSSPSIYNLSAGSGNIDSINTFFTLITGVVSLNFINTVPYTIISSDIAFSMGTILQMIGFIIALMVSFDLMEALSDVLGAPSMTSNNLLRRFI